MKSLLKNWTGIENRIKDSDHVLLFLDYDGTLTPIVNRPDRALLSPSSRKLLEELHGNPRYTLAVISGRALRDVRALVGLRGLIYAGNHGLELAGPKIRYISHHAKKARPLLGRIARRLQRELRVTPGAVVENKGLSLTIHFRKVKTDERQLVAMIFDGITRPYRQKRKIRIARGKCIFEVKPPVKWNKGTIVLWLLKRTEVIKQTENILPIYLGDDLTDEDAFQVLSGLGITALVGRPNPLSRAEYHLAGVRGVRTFLQKLATLQ